ncbi:MAG: T9SS type A sorting domain-containing protein, partial [Ignavibacteriae bacterium]|nr:T9SS type A sorting domain-containing protein [Ignavibacteriota bacterium]
APVNVINYLTNDCFILFQNYLNSFNPITTIKYQLPAKVKSETIPTGRQAVNVKLIVFDILGREVTTLVNQRQNPGNYEVAFDGKKLPTGIYFYRLSAGNYVETKKMILLK